MLIALVVVARIFANPVANVFQKQLAQRAVHPIAIVASTHTLLTLVCLPLLFLFVLPLRLGPEFWIDMTICALLAIAGNVLLVHALHSLDLSVLGPLNAYKAVIGLILGVFVIGEIPTAIGLIGVVLILAGSIFVVDRPADQARRHALAQFFRERGVRLRFAALGLSAAEAIFLKKALLLSSPLATFLSWAILGLPIAFAAITLLLRERQRNEIAMFRRNWSTCVWLAFATGLMQLATVFTFAKLQVGYSLALFQLSALVSVFLGYRYFEERHIRKRLVASVIMVAGAALIVAQGVRR